MGLHASSMIRNRLRLSLIAFSCLRRIRKKDWLTSSVSSLFTGSGLFCRPCRLLVVILPSPLKRSGASLRADMNWPTTQRKVVLLSSLQTSWEASTTWPKTASLTLPWLLRSVVARNAGASTSSPSAKRWDGTRWWELTRPKIWKSYTPCQTTTKTSQNTPTWSPQSTLILGSPIWSFRGEAWCRVWRTRSFATWTGRRWWSWWR